MQTNIPEIETEIAPSSAPNSKPNGRPPYVPTNEHRARVKILGRHGVPQNDIAASLGISTPTLRKHYRQDLKLAAAEANEQVLDSLYQLATSRRCAAAAIFWAKTRCNFRQKGSSNAGR
jgi:DNA-binding CsgD family transcriptional regulator